MSNRQSRKAGSFVSAWHLPDFDSTPDALNYLEVRPIQMDEWPRWKTLMSQHHYLGFQNTVGESLCYIATIAGHWVALLAWAAAVLRSRHREAWVGWTAEVKKRRLHFVANNVRFLIHPGIRLKNLASKVLGCNVKRLSHDWEIHYNHPILIVETFVDESRFRGTCYRAAGWVPLGKTRGFGKNRRGYFTHGSIKTLYVRRLTPQSVKMLSAPFPPAIQCSENRLLDINDINIEGKGGLLDLLDSLADPRKLRGRRHSIVTITTIAVCACLAGASSYQGIAKWASGLSSDAMRRLRGSRVTAPSEATFRRVLKQLDGDALNRRLSSWLEVQISRQRKSIAQSGTILWIGRKQ